MSGRVYVALLNWRSWGDTIECLESIFRNEYTDYRVIVCDNLSGDDSVERMAAWAEGKLDALASDVPLLRALTHPPLPKPIRYITYERDEAEAGGRSEEGDPPLVFIQNGANLGFAAGMNVAIRYALARDDFDYFWLLNNDTVIPKDSLTALVRRMKERPEAGQCGSTILYYKPPHNVQCLGGGTLNRWLCRGQLFASVPKGDTPSIATYVEKRLDFVFGASLLARKSFLKEIGLLSEDFFLWHEDIDWSLRGATKFKLAFAADSIVYHRSGASSGREEQKFRSYISDRCYQENRLTLAIKFFPIFTPIVYLSYMGAIANRALSGKWNRVVMIIGIMLRGLVGKVGSARKTAESAQFRSGELVSPDLTYTTIFVRNIARISFPIGATTVVRRRAQGLYQPFGWLSRALYKLWCCIPLNIYFLYQKPTLQASRFSAFDWRRWLDAVAGKLNSDSLTPVFYFPPQLGRAKVFVILQDVADQPVVCAKLADGDAKQALIKEIAALEFLKKSHFESFRYPKNLLSGTWAGIPYVVLSHEAYPLSVSREWGDWYTRSWLEFVEKTGKLIPVEQKLWSDLPAVWQDVCHRIEANRRSSRFLHCAVHGDFAPWNILLAPDQLVLIDWEHFAPCAPCFADPAHFVLSVHLRGRNKSAKHCVTALQSLSESLETAPKDVALSLAYLASTKQWPADILHDLATNILDGR